MRLKRCFLPALIFSALMTAFSGRSQVVPSALEGRLPITVGAGVSNFNADWGNGRINGGGMWIAWYPAFVPHPLHGLGLELEAHDLSWGRSPSLPAQFRQDTAGGGAIYSWHHFRNVRPYVKGLVEFGSFDFGSGTPGDCCYNHDTRTLLAEGAGLDYHVWGHIWARGDYEYQIWQNIGALGTGDPTPNGFTFGAIFDFRSLRSER